MATPLSERPGVLGAFARFYRRTYLGDYVGFVLLQAAYLITKFLITPVHRPFLISDLRISHEYANPERVTTYENFLYAGVAPLVVIVLYCVAVRPGFHRSHVTILGFLISLSFSGFLTHVFKNAIGRARPDLLARCVIKKGTPADVLVTISVCEQTDQYKLNDGWRSFPSGHSSFAWAGLGYLSLFLAGQLHTLRPRTDLARVLVTVCPLLGAFLVAASRTADYRHDVYDVTAGSILGFIVALFGYRRYYPSPLSPNCHLPFPSPLDDTKAERRLPSARQDEEDARSQAESFDLNDLTEEEDEDESHERQPLTTGNGTQSRGKPKRGDSE
ncbi:Diacylglycerol pyrophosphate phosphatase 1 [Cyphellophora attinorum]|uniref:Diacylglycerol pyrophosphate phosphatase 1 n=1 Tax=Cyphellophora attinorum TaxID=1664694 RepID=A0A0N1HTK8_9EURO|nr:Diacylglycerol pyrophosphate phosphatase 1 [Phialophora attinorum]KPI39903.1 Diacylglycerol pyrophosphate phosphatase 1 [Phialophora attinorum]